MTSKCGLSYIRDLYLGLLITRPTVELRVAPRSNCRDRTAFHFLIALQRQLHCILLNVTTVINLTELFSRRKPVLTG
jgi:hypothetical protein